MTAPNETPKSEHIAPAYVAQMMLRVRRMARTLRRRLPPWVLEEDLIGAGNLGLAAALARGDASDPVRFDAFVVCHIRGAMLEELRQRDVMSRGQRQRARLVGEAAKQLCARFNRPAEHEEVAEAVGMTHDQYWETLEATARSATTSLESMLDLGCQVAAQPSYDSSPDLAADVHRTWERVCAEARQLSERERLVLDLELGHGMCPVEVARKLNVTKSRVSQLRTRAVTRLRDAIGASRASLLPARPAAVRRSLRKRMERVRVVRLSLAPMPSAGRAPNRAQLAGSANLDPNGSIDLAAGTTGLAASPARRPIGGWIQANTAANQRSQPG
jgi:RNA polymerase sigma factor for flagellar operon FliA